MRTPNDHLRALLLELTQNPKLPGYDVRWGRVTDSAIARAHNRAYEGSALAASSVYRFRTDPQENTPTPLLEEAYAAATGTTREQNWNEAFKRWRAATRQKV